MHDETADTLDRLTEEYVSRLRAGEDPAAESYARAHPALADRIRDLFPVLAVMEGLKRPAAVGPGPTEAATPPAPGAPAADAPLPARIGPYAIVREVGRGGMGRVYEVRDDGGRRFALKVVHPHLLQRAGFLARFLREIEAGLRVRHPGVVGTLASGVADLDGAEVPYVLLEYVEGDTLRDLLDETGAVSERLAREVGAATAEALAAVHAAGIVHRDVKPENVIIAPDERVKLMDLGVALLQEEALRLTQTGEFVGSLLYAAPEQLRRRQIDARTDLYALGLVLFELVAGRHAEASGQGSALAQKLEARRAPRLREVVPSATPFFERVVERLLAPEPHARFSSAAEVAQILAEGETGAWWIRVGGPDGTHGRSRRVHGGVPLFGREAERAALDAAWSQVRAGAGQVRVVRGEPGMGKSRLVFAWLDDVEAREPATAVLWVEHAPGSGVYGLTPIAHALHELLGDDPLDRLRAWLADRADRAEDVLASLRSADLGHAVAGPLDRAALETMVVLLVRGLAAERPVVILVEDLHFATDEGRALFERLAHAFTHDAVLLIGTVRPAEPPIPHEDLLDLPHVDVVDLTALDEEAALGVLQAGLGSGPHALDAVRALVRVADGNPYCLLEFARDLRARAGTGGDLHADLVLPRSIQRLVEARLGSLRGDDRDLLALAACCGHRFDPVVVCAAAGLPRLGGLRALHRLERERGLLVADGMEYRFHHHLVQEALYDEVPPALRATYHAALGAACEARLEAGAAVGGADACAVARHFLLGEAPERAAPYVVAGIDHLLSLGEGRRAARMARRALEGLPDASPDLRARLLFCRGRALDGNAPPSEVVGALREALDAARAVGERSLELDALQHLGAAVSHTGRHAEAAEISAMAVDLAEGFQDPVRLARALTSHATSRYNMGAYEEAFAAGRRALAVARGASAALQAGQTATILSALYLQAGRVDEARPLAEFALSATHLHGDRGAEQFVLGVLAKMVHVQGDVGGALPLIQRSAALARELGNLRLATATEIGATQVLLNLGRLDEAIAGADRALAICASMGYVEIAALLSVPRAFAASVAGDLGGAWEAASRGHDLLAQVPLPAIVARVLPAVAHVLAWMGGFDEARGVIQRGTEAAQEAGVPRESAQVRQAGASLLDAQGRTREAALLYAEVLEELRAGSMGLYVALVLQRLGGLHVRLGDVDAARACLAEAIDLGERAPLPGVVATAGIWLDLLPGGNLQRARIALERDAHALAARARLRLWLELAHRTGDPGHREQARALAQRLLESAPEAWRGRMAADVPLHRDALA